MGPRLKFDGRVLCPWCASQDFTERNDDDWMVHTLGFYDDPVHQGTGSCTGKATIECVASPRRRLSLVVVPWAAAV